VSQQSLEIVGQRGDKFQPIAGAWVIENQFIDIKTVKDYSGILRIIYGNKK